MSKEFEVSLRIDDASKIRDYYEHRQPLRVINSSLSRQIYKDGSDLMARVTSEGSGDDEVTRLDFKEDSPASEAIKDVRESLPVDISEATKESVQSLLSTLGYELFRDFKKDRTTYVFKTFHIDIDEYTVPEKATVFEVEGQPAAVEAEYAVLQEHQLLSSQDTSE